MVRNNGRHAYNVTSISGVLTHPMDTSVVAQNFTAFRYDQLVPPGYEVSMSYLFPPSESIEVRDYTFLGYAFYQTEDGIPFVDTYHNTSLVIVEPLQGLDFQMFSTYLMGVGILAGIGYLVYKFVLGGGKKSTRKAAAAHSATGKSTDKDDWLSDSNVGSWKNKKNQ